MSTAKLIKAQVELFTNLEKRFKDRITAQNLEQRITGVADDKAKQIEARIKALGVQKTATIARFDAAIKTEKTALAEVKSRRIDPKQRPTDPGGRPPTKAKKLKGRTKSGTTKAKPRTKGK